MKRRAFLKLGGAGLVASAGLAGSAETVRAAVACSGPETASDVRLAVTQSRMELIDGEMIDVLAYKVLGSSAQARVPGPVIRVREGDEVTITITNSRPEAHGFEITGCAGSKATVAPGQTCRITFTAPLAGTYLYHDPSHRSRHLYRVLGLHGAFVVHPRNGWSRNEASKRCITPYSLDRLSGADAEAVRRVSMVFEAFGTTDRFPGGRWVPSPADREYSQQEKIWLFNQVDPKFNKLVRSDGIANSAIAASSAAMVANFVPRYFTINGRSGFDLASGEDVVVKNYIGEPTLLRTLNAGLCHHATHIHGNHVLELAHSVLTDDAFVPIMGAPRTGKPGEVVLHNNIWERDVWPTWPMQIRDVLLPLEAPPDIPNWEKHVALQAYEAFPLRYVMHDHCEMGTTAAGGNYPQGAVTHWEIHGPVNGRGRT